MNSIENKKIVVINPRKLETDIEKNIYSSWYSTWDDAIKNDLKLDMQLYSDDFTRQDHICAIYDFEKNQTVGMTFFRYIDFSCKSSRQDSYFKEWPELARRGLIRKGQKVAVCCQFTVCPDYRLERQPFKWKDAMVYASVSHLLYNTNCDVMTGAVRVNKSVNTASYESGAASLLMPNVFNESFGAHEDLVAFYREDVAAMMTRNTDHPFLELVTNSFEQISTQISA